MTQKNRILVATMLLLFIASVGLQADVKRESTNRIDFTGTLGVVMKFFGAGKPRTAVEYYQGNVYRSDYLDEKGKNTTSQIIDLDRELFINIDHKGKKFTQMTFEEFRQLMAQNLKKMEDEPQQAREQEANVEWDFKVNVTKTGETEMIAGQSAEKVIIKMEITSKTTQPATDQQPAQTAQGDLIVTSSNWMVKSLAGQNEINNFYQRLGEKLGMVPGKSGMAEMMKQLQQSHPQLAEAMAKLQEEVKKLSGVAVRTHTIYEAQSRPVAGAEQPAEQKRTEIPTSVGGLLKGLGKKMAKSDQPQTQSNVLMEIHDELLSSEVSPIDGSQFTVPANYKQEKIK